MNAPAAVTTAQNHKNTPLQAMGAMAPSQAQQVDFQKKLDAPGVDPTQKEGSTEDKDKEPLLTTTGQTSKDENATWSALQKAMVNNIVQDGNRQASNFRMRLKETYMEASQPLPPKKH